jgi:hypothetical protein
LIDFSVRAWRWDPALTKADFSVIDAVVKLEARSIVVGYVLPLFAIKVSSTRLVDRPSSTLWRVGARWPLVNVGLVDPNFHFDSSFISLSSSLLGNKSSSMLLRYDDDFEIDSVDGNERRSI